MGRPGNGWCLSESLPLGTPKQSTICLRWRDVLRPIDADVPHCGERYEGRIMTTKKGSRGVSSPGESDARRPHAPVTSHVTAPVAAPAVAYPAAVPASISGKACRDFEASLAKLQAVTEQMQHTEDADGIDSIAFTRALDDYQRARLVWLSSEITVRRSAVG